jgi:hypothetical protein
MLLLLMSTRSTWRRCTGRFFSTDKKIIEQQEELLFPRTVQTIKEQQQPKEEQIDDWNQTLMTKEELSKHGEEWRKKHGIPAEHGFGYLGNEPTMFGDWQHKGRTTDF